MTLYLPLLRDIAGVVLVLAGLIGIIMVAFAFDARAGWGAVSVLAVVFGALLSVQRGTSRE